MMDSKELQELAKAEEASSKRNTVIAVVALIFFAVTGFIIYYVIPMLQEDDVERKPRTLQTGAQNQSEENLSGNAAQNENSQNENQNENAHENQERSDAFGEAVRAAHAQQSPRTAQQEETPQPPEEDDIIARYKKAIAQNAQNLPAWYGLLEVYRERAMSKEAQETEAQMINIFGGNIVVICDFVKLFGDITRSRTNNRGTYSLEYRTRKREKGEVLTEVFSMTRAIRNICDCTDISIFAATDAGGRGLLAKSTAATPMQSQAAFSQNAEIIWLD